jgi:hypothetical protein
LQEGDERESGATEELPQSKMKGFQGWDFNICAQKMSLLFTVVDLTPPFYIILLAGFLLQWPWGPLAFSSLSALVLFQSSCPTEGVQAVCQNPGSGQNPEV